LEEQVSILEEQVFAKAELLSDSRSEASKRLEASVLAIVVTLGMPHARFIIKIDRMPPDGGKMVVGPTGADDLEFYVSANKGEPLRPLASVASGGELSRLMLSLKTALAQDDGADTLVFDEVDTGIGGEVALGVGAHLRALSKTKQVLCITHLASIAARADNHLMVEKCIDGDRTVTRISRLIEEDRVKEIARMLSGDSQSRTSLDHAADMVAKLGSKRGA
jgi:DNA repair protein RecN (Recombination protein N)